MTSWPMSNGAPMLVPRGARHRVNTRLARAVWAVTTSALVGGWLAFMLVVSMGWVL